jgi:hypothetical protein
MPFENLTTVREPISMEELGQRLAKRKAELAALGINVEIPRNPGKNRTASKRALLEAIAATGAKW